MSQFQKKSFGRIYVADPDAVEEVAKIIEELDPFEYEYLPKSFIAPWTGKIEPTYGYKFEADIYKITEACWNQGIWVFCVTGLPDPVGHLP